MFKRITLFIITNIFIMVTLSIVLNVLGVRPYLTRSGIDYQSLMVFCLVWGMGGALISLALSRFTAKMMMGVKVIDPHSAGEYAWLVNMVSQLAQSAGLPSTPEVGVFPSPTPNAFATGPTKNRALVAFSSGILQQMNREEIEGVAGHEITHIQNGDMVTMTLIQGVVNAFVMFLARVIGYFVSQSVREESRRGVQFLVTIVLEIGIGILGVMVVAWFSRQREFRADAGSARIAGREKMIAGLERLRNAYGQVARADAQPAIAALMISGKSTGILSLFATHPPLEERIAALKALKV